ncbi:alpha/beta hydrolase [Natronococcus sp. A-GB7]|uniref:alpha/beta fold hydrolase n=1 Tax=Natronococcus sp. A-GB7 TaxID=3037649 RepID=UPI00241FAF89|nr:alpha/beta hydrolase [Natronococcus sp. A-GB7]MDG5818400.1 alpha/beta hydrolase [Natronococcus sp. A-GB7]
MTEHTLSDTATEMETVTSADGTEIAFERTGRGTPFVLVHGASIDHRYWDLSGVRDTVAERHTVYAMDCRGHGESEHPGEFELEREFEDVVAVVDSIDEPVALLAESGGAFHALEAALRTDNLRSLVLHEPAVPGFEAALDVDEVFATMLALLDDGENDRAVTVFLEELALLTPDELEALHTDPTWPAYVDTFLETILPKLEAAVAADYEFDPDRFAELTVPTLLVAGSESGEWLLDATDAVADALPNGRVVTIDGHGHEANVTAPDRFTNEVLAFTRDRR